MLGEVLQEKEVKQSATQSPLAVSARLRWTYLGGIADFEETSTAIENCDFGVSIIIPGTKIWWGRKTYQWVRRPCLKQERDTYRGESGDGLPHEYGSAGA